MTGPDGLPLCDANGDPITLRAPVTHVDHTALRGRVEAQASPSKVTVAWSAVGGLPAPQRKVVLAEFLLLVPNGDTPDDQ